MNLIGTIYINKSRNLVKEKLTHFYLLQDFRGFEASGHQDSIHKLTLARLDSGDASLAVYNSLTGEKLIEGELEDVKVPRECKPRFSRNDLELMPGFLNDLGEEVPEVDNSYALKCLYEGSVYEDGSQWKATHEACKMCSCQRYFAAVF